MRIKLHTWLWMAACFLAVCGTASPQTFAKAEPGYRYEFPRDHFNHPAYQTEWWYYTGNLRAQNGHRFGFELTFFRQANARDVSTSPWALRDFYMAHLALSDVSGRQYYSTERLNRAGPGIAGVDASDRTVWNGNSQTVISPDDHHLRGMGENFSLDLDAVPQKTPVIQGESGISQKGIGSASHYISFTRMLTTGSVQLNGATFAVEGDAWMDHEFFTSPTAATEVAWDWLSIQLGDNTELMLYRLRHSDGSVDPFSSGSYIDQTGRVTHLALPEFTMVPEGATWKSSATGAIYPVAWTVAIPKLQLKLEVTTPLEHQEFVSHFGPSYWEGAIDVNGSRGNAAIHGSGYLEMTGYARQAKPMISR